MPNKTDLSIDVLLQEKSVYKLLREKCPWTTAFALSKETNALARVLDPVAPWLVIIVLI